ncbi:MAG: hypothetical protein ACOCQR_02275 [bacterium]
MTDIKKNVQQEGLPLLGIGDTVIERKSGRKGAIVEGQNNATLSYWVLFEGEKEPVLMGDEHVVSA